MQGPDEPPQSDLVIESLQAVPRFSRGGDIYQRQKNPCDNLKQEHGQCGAAEDIKPACGITRDAVPGRFPDRFTNLQALIEPARRPSRSGAWRPLTVRAGGGAPGCRHFAGLDQELSIHHLVAGTETARAAEVRRRVSHPHNKRRRGTGT